MSAVTIGAKVKTAGRHFLLLLAGLLLAPSVLLAEPVVVASDTVWSGRVVIDEVAAVSAEATLTILPGTEIRFRRTAGEGSLLVVYGRLVALGTAEQPILFGSAEADPHPGDWQGIYFEGGKSRDNLLRHCRIEYARTAVGGVRSRVTVEKTLLSRNLTAYRGDNDLRGMLRACEIKGNEKGIELVKSGETQIENCRIAGNTGQGIACQGCSPAIRCNRIEENGAAGIFCRNEASPLIENNLILGNRRGIQAERQVAPIIRHNEIADNDTGIWLEKMAFPLIEKNLIRENRVGVCCNLSSYPRLTGNNISGNREYALDLGPKQSIVVSRNFPYRQREGIAETGSAGPEVFRKNLLAKFAPGFPEDSLIDARGNWWGEQALAEMQASGTDANLSFIEDFHDFKGNSNPRDRFAYAPWASAPFSDAGRRQNRAE